MDIEILVCSSCSKKWERHKTRGRKPLVCPECVSLSVSNKDSSSSVKQKAEPFQQKQVSKKDNSIKYPAPSHWICKSCLISVKIHISLEYPPIHLCKKRLSKEFPLEMV